MRRIPVILLLVLCACVIAQAQSISGVVNLYTNVTNITAADVTVGSSAGFSVGDKVLLIQMKGANVATPNNATFGTITAYNDAGNFEFACISAVTGNVISLGIPPQNTYTISGNVQLVRVPVYANPVVTATLTAAPWNGTTGGVLCIETPGVLTMNADMDVTGLGFRGGNFGTGGFSCAHSDYFSPIGQGGEKGESITAFLAGYEAARGKWANGGGGANRGNCGGGGGGSYSTGGDGGRIYSGCGGSVIQGVGGETVGYSPTKIFLGGGGGGGFRDNGRVTAPGSNGGGIVILLADTIVGNANSIIADGADVTIITADEGAGGGGGAGAVYIITDTIFNNLSVETNGGDGGNTFNGIFTSQCHGPGGGGAGGICWVSLPTIPAVLTHTANGGASGLVQNPASTCFNTTFQGTAGSPGSIDSSLVVLVGDTANADLGNDTTICVNDTLILDPGPGYVSYLWSDGSTNQTLPVTVADTYWVEIQGACGSARDTIVVGLDTLPIVNIGPDTVVCIGDTVVFDAGPGFASYVWHDASINPTFQSDTTGTFSITVTDGNGCEGRDTAVMTNYPRPPVNLGPDTLICQGASITFDAGPGFVGYLWQDMSTLQTFTATTSGQYYVEITDANGCTNSDTINLVVAPLPPVNLGNDTAFCNGNIHILNAGAGFPSYLWQNGDNSQTFIVSTSGQYHVLITDANGCQNRDTINITVNPNPVINLGNDTLLCPGEVLTLDPGPGFVRYSWSTGALTQSINVSTTGLYWVEVEDVNGCIGRDTIDVFVGQLSVNIGPDLDICAGEVVLLDPGPGYSSVVWQDGFVGRPYRASAAGQYIVTVTGVGGCIAEDTMNINNVFPLPVISLGPDSVICIGETLVLDPGAGFSAYQWQDASSNQTYNATTIGMYWVRVTDGNGCVGADTMRITDRIPVPNVSAGSDRSFCVGDSAILEARPSGGLWSYSWSTGDNSETTIVRQEGTYSVTVTNRCGTDVDDITILPLREPPVISLPQDTFHCENQIVLSVPAYPSIIWSDGSTDRTYIVNNPDTIWVMATNSCGSDSDSILVLDGCPPPLFWPNAFTPNGDGNNETFQPVGLPVQNFSLVVYDRWGNEIFVSSNQNDGWDGRIGGNDAPEGVYVWRSTYEFEDLGKLVKNEVAGSVMIIR